MSAIDSTASQTADMRPTFRRPKIVLPIPAPASKFQKAQPGVPNAQLTREATGLLHEFSTPLLFNHSHRVFFWANELGHLQLLHPELQAEQLLRSDPGLSLPELVAVLYRYRLSIR
jgi:hypothetical protein